jgi:lipoic acid synthetase
MICGDICTRCCKFCNTAVGKPFPLDAAEPQKIAETVKILGLKYVVLTSVDRDDLPDLGATHWVKTIEKVRSLNPDTRIEALIPDFQGNEQWIAAVCRQKPYIVGHNMETVRRLTPSVRSAARYDISLQVLRLICTYGCTAKTGIMAGLGETVEEIEETMDDILATGCLRLTIGQYLQPSSSHLPVQKYYTPDEYDEFRRIALGKGFTRVDSGALVRSSYHAEE